MNSPEPVLTRLPGPGAAAPWLMLALLLAPLPALAAASNPGEAQDELRELRGRISAMQKKLAASEEIKSEASDALRESERAISEASRELRDLARQSRESGAKLGDLRKTARETETRLRAQQDALGRMLRRQYLQGEPDALRLLLARENPNDMARQMKYLGHIAGARARLVEGLRADLAELERLGRDIADEAAAIARITAEQALQKKRLEQEKRARAEVLNRVSRDIRAQQQQIRSLQANENRLTRLIEQLTRLAQQRPPPRKPAAERGPRPRNEALPADSGERAFAALRGTLALPVRGELAGRFGSPRSDGGITWKGVFIQARSGEDVRAVAAGRVVYADWLRGFGNLLIIDHGDSYMTLYANAESLLRQVGDTIRGGESVATVGNSGGNAESGLYFEMRHAGRPFDPLSWVRLR
ncbi:MAG: murein hydrolase activator EnvC family protein [Betaproteobacteria bacterium]